MPGWYLVGARWRITWELFWYLKGGELRILTSEVGAKLGSTTEVGKTQEVTWRAATYRHANQSQREKDPEAREASLGCSTERINFRFPK